MNSSNTIDEKVLSVTVRVKAALELIPGIVGPKDVWMPWMRDKLDAELRRLPRPTLSSPHPKLIGSLAAMLLRHYSGGMELDTLCFEDVRADDPSTIGPEYVDVSGDALPTLEGVDTWWKVLPSEVGLRANTPLQSSKVPSEIVEESSNCTSRSRRSELKLKSKVNRNAGGQQPESGKPSRDAAKSRLSVRFSDQNDSGTTRASGTSRILTHSKGRKRIAEDDDDDSPPLQKRKKFKSKKFVESDEDDVQSHPVPNKGKARMLQDPEVLEVEKVCDGCKTRGSKCEWPSQTKSSDKRACAACVSLKTRCEIMGEFQIRRPRGKAAVTRQPTSRGEVDELRELINEMSTRVAEMERQQAEEREGSRRLVAQAHNLQVQVEHLTQKMVK
ncbi:hypothetical protein V8E55_002584 [Tylopilus felleus]